ncbi:unnamed protein product [Phaeothamnion confervicola]
MLAAFVALPGEERQRIGVDRLLTLEPLERLAALDELWKRRQEELQEATDAMVKPAELLKSRIAVLHASRGAGNSSSDNASPSVATMVGVCIASSTNATACAASRASDAAAKTRGLASKRPHQPPQSHKERLEALESLEDLLSDVDMARDFHTLGGWDELVAHLAADTPNDARTMAAWAVGTAIKNMPEFQLWALEPAAAAGGRTALELLIDSLSSAAAAAEAEAAAAALAANTATANGAAAAADAGADADATATAVAKPDYYAGAAKTVYALSAALGNNVALQRAFGAFQGPRALARLFVAVGTGGSGGKEALRLRVRLLTFVADLLGECERRGGSIRSGSGVGGDGGLRRSSGSGSRDSGGSERRDGGSHSDISDGSSGDVGHADTGVGSGLLQDQAVCPVGAAAAADALQWCEGAHELIEAAADDMRMLERILHILPRLHELCAGSGHFARMGTSERLRELWYMQEQFREARAGEAEAFYDNELSALFVGALAASEA